MIKPLHHLQFHQLPPNYEAVLEKDYHHLIILGTGEKAKGLHANYWLLGQDKEEEKLLEPFVVKSPEELLEKAGLGTAYDTYQSLCKPFGNLEVSILLVDYDYLEDTFLLLENLDFSFLLLDDHLRVDEKVRFVKEPMLLQDPSVNPILLETVDLFQRLFQLAELLLQRGRLIHVISLAHIKDEIQQAEVFSTINGFRQYDRHEFIEKGRYVTVVFDQLQGELAHAYYAALALVQDVHESPTNKEIGRPVLKKALEAHEHKFYERNGVVTLIDSYHRGVVFANCTTAIITEDEMHKHMPHEKIAQFLISLLANSFYPVVGMPINTMTSKKVESILETIRSYMKVKKGYVKDLGYAFHFDNARGELYIKVIAVPVSSLNEMEIETQVKVVIT